MRYLLCRPHRRWQTLSTMMTLFMVKQIRWGWRLILATHAPLAMNALRAAVMITPIFVLLMQTFAQIA